MRRQNIINYELDSQLTKDLEQYLREGVYQIFHNKINEDYFDYLKLITSIENKDLLENRKQDIKEALEKEDPDKVDKLIDFLHGDYVKKYEELLKQFKQKNQKEEDKPTKKAPPAPNKTEGKSILDRIKPKNDAQAKDLKQVTDQQEPEKSAKDPSKIRCKFWPSCKVEDCPYAHPKEQCKHFPHCIFGDKCINIHPQIPCKFGLNCKRPNCAYVHPGIMHMIRHENLKRNQVGQGGNFK